MWLLMQRQWIQYLPSRKHSYLILHRKMRESSWSQKGWTKFRNRILKNNLAGCLDIWLIALKENEDLVNWEQPSKGHNAISFQMFSNAQWTCVEELHQWDQIMHFLCNAWRKFCNCIKRTLFIDIGMNTCVKGSIHSNSLYHEKCLKRAINVVSTFFLWI